MVEPVRYERESTLRIPIEKSHFQNVYAMFQKFKSNQTECMCSESLDTKLFQCLLCVRNGSSGCEYNDTVTLYGQNFRLAGRSFELKTTDNQQHVAMFYRGKFFPIVRSDSSEQRLPLPKTLDEIMPITKSLYRFTITKRYNLDKVNDDDDDDAGVSTEKSSVSGYSKLLNCRLSYNSEEDGSGVFYHLSCEVEYCLDTTYEECIRYENRMFLDFFEYFKDINVPMDSQSLNDLFACVAPKVQMYSCFDPKEDYLWAYKWNGIKSKFMINSENRVLLWPDTADQKSLFISGNPEPIKHINFQAEIMPDSIVLVHAISASFFGKIYTIEPYTSVSVLNYVRDLMKHVVVHDPNPYRDYKLVIQKFYPAPKPKYFDVSKYDGFILAQKTLFIKWKTPTIDAKYAGLGVFEIGHYGPGGQIIKFTLDAEQTKLALAECTVGNIYELSAKLSLLRERNDRLICSTLAEYEVFIKNVKLLEKMQ